MDLNRLKAKRRTRRKRRVRKKIFGTGEKPRMTVFRSDKHIYVQLVDDLSCKTLCEASTRDRDLRDSVGYGGNKSAAAVIGKVIAERGVSQGLSRVVFDRNGYKYHGRVKALADAAREAGLKL